MKKYIMIILFVLGVEVVAQTDRFFIYDNNNIGNAAEYEMLLLPEQHGLDYNYYADKVPLESGCLLLLGMGLVYAKFKKQV